jgi:hypothetical protein
MSLRFGNDKNCKLFEASSLSVYFLPEGLSRFSFGRLSEKQKNLILWVLCGANERSEWAVKKCIHLAA